jgi:hypothetical protein
VHDPYASVVQFWMRVVAFSERCQLIRVEVAKEVVAMDEMSGEVMSTSTGGCSPPASRYLPNLYICCISVPDNARL